MDSMMKSGAISPELMLMLGSFCLSLVVFLIRLNQVPPPRLIDKRHRAHGWVIHVLARYCKYDLIYDHSAASSALSLSPLGLLPILITPHEDVICSSGAIARYIGQKTGLNGETEEDQTLNETLIEEYQQLYRTLESVSSFDRRLDSMKVNTSALKASALVHLTKLEQLLNSRQRLLVGDVMILCLLHILQHLNRVVFEGFPVITQFYTSFKSLIHHDSWKFKDYFFVADQ